MIVSGLFFVVWAIWRGRAPATGTFKVAVPFFAAAGVVILVTGVAVVFLPAGAVIVAEPLSTVIALVLIFAGAYRRRRADKARRLG